jgi:hypothetical protein
MSHPFAPGSGDAGNKRYHRLGHPKTDKLRSFLLHSAAYFTDKDYSPSILVRLKQLQDVDKSAARQGITADPYAGSLSNSQAG